MPVALLIALTHLRSRRRQTAVSVLGVTLGVGFFIAVSSLMRGSQDDFVETLVNAAPHIVVKDEFRQAPPQPVMRAYADGAVALSGVKPRDEVRGIRAYKQKLELIERTEDVAVAPALQGQAILRYGGRDRAVSLTGIEPEREVRVTRLAEDMVSGRLTDLRSNANGLVIGLSLARDFGLSVGDSVTLTSSAGTRQLMQVVGVFSTGSAAVDGSVVYTLLRRAQVLLDRPNVANRLHLKVAEPGNARAVALRIERRIAYRTESWQETNEEVLGLLVIRNAIMYTIVGAILLVASFGIFNIISTVVLEKTRDIAILKSMGFRAADVRRIFVIEGTLVGVAGGLLGIAVGYGLMALLASLEFEIPEMTEAQGFPLYYGLDQYLIASAFALLAAVGAAYLPARKAARLRPVDSIRGAA